MKFTKLKILFCLFVAGHSSSIVWLVPFVVLFPVVAVLSARQELKPSVSISTLQLKFLCDEDEWIPQFEKVRSRWSACLGFRRIYLPTEVGSLSKSVHRRLQYFMSSGDESLNPYCVLNRNWNVCLQYLRPVNCIASNSDIILRAKNPKYTPLTKIMKAPGTGGKRRRNREENLESMADLYSIQCDAIKLSHHYMNPNMMRMDHDGMGNDLDYKDDLGSYDNGRGQLFDEL